MELVVHWLQEGLGHQWIPVDNVAECKALAEELGAQCVKATKATIAEWWAHNERVQSQ